MELTVGAIIEGKVTGITNFGAFVDLGDGKTGMVHISEVALTYVSDIHQFVKENDTVKVKVLNIDENGKVSLSIKKALENNKPKSEGRRAPAKAYVPDTSFVWGEQKKEAVSFEDMMNKFKQTSDEKMSDLKRKNADTRRPKRNNTMK